MKAWHPVLDISITILVVGIASVAIWFTLSTRSTGAANAPSYTIDGWQGHNRNGIRLGPEPAPLEITAFLDLTCPFSRGLIPVLDSIRAQHPDEVAVIWQHFPLSGRPHSREAAIAAECAREQGVFEAAVSAIIGVEEERLAGVADSVRGIVPDGEAFIACTARSPASFSLIAAHRNTALITGARGTPHVWVNGRVFSGRSVEDFADALTAARLN